MPDETLREFEGLKILVADDNATSAAAVGTILGSWRCRWTTAPNEESLLVSLHKAARLADPFHIALVDLDMLSKGAENLTAQLASDSVMARIRLVMMISSNRGPKECVSQHFVRKPILESRLRDALNIALGKKQASSEPTRANRLNQLIPQIVGARILVAEDIASNRDVAAAILSKLGYHADFATNGLEALAALSSANYDLVLMDCEMPEMDGYEATQRIRQEEKSGGSRHLPIVALTARAISGDQVKCIEAGMDDYLRKPIEPQKLAEALARWIKATPPAPPKAPPPPPPPDEPAHPVFDETELLGRMMGDRALAGKVVAKFLQDAPSLLDRLRERLKAGDAVESRRRARGLKGAAATISAAGLRDAALKIEDAAQAGDLTGAGQLLPILDDQLEQLSAVLRTAGWV